MSDGHADHIASVSPRPILDLFTTCKLGPQFGRLIMTPLGRQYAVERRARSLFWHLRQVQGIDMMFIIRGPSPRGRGNVDAFLGPAVLGTLL